MREKLNRERAERERLALRRERHREQIATILGDAQIELDRRRADEQARVDAFEAEAGFSWAATNSSVARPTGRDSVSIKLRDVSLQDERDHWNFRE